MFKQKTLLIVGAGASAEAGLPVGSRLLETISSSLNIRYKDGYTRSSGDALIDQAFRQIARTPDGRSGDINPYLHKCWRIVDAAKQGLSIDNIIDQHDGDEMLQLCGKLGIVKAIADAERASKMFDRDGYHNGGTFDVGALRDTWYLRFGQKLAENVRPAMLDSMFDNLSIITFNYDRCIEHFLVQSLMTSYGIGQPRAQEVVNRLRIHHPYGQVGRLPWQSGPGPKVKFGPEGADYQQLAAEIRTFSERLDDEQAIAAIRSEVQSARQIIFLGFAFHPQNLELLEVSEAAETKTVFATAYGISEADQRAIKDDVNAMLKRPKRDGMSTPEMNFLAAPCAGLFEHYWRSISG